MCWAYRFLVYIRNIYEIKASITADDCLLLNCCLIFAVSCPLLHCSANQPPPLAVGSRVFILTISPYYYYYYYYYCFYYYLVSSLNKINQTSYHCLSLLNCCLVSVAVLFFMLLYRDHPSIQPCMLHIYCIKI